MTTTNIAGLPYGYPKEITAWVDSFISHDPALRSNTQGIILRILCHDKASKSARELFPKLMEDENWPENFTTFIEKVAEISINMPKYFYTPKQFSDQLAKVLKLAKSLEEEIGKCQEILSASNLDDLLQEMAEFQKFTKMQLAHSLDKKTGPNRGTEDGTKAERNWVARQVGTLAQMHLGELFPVYSAAVARALLGIRYGMTESNIRTLFSGKTYLYSDS